MKTPTECGYVQAGQQSLYASFYSPSGGIEQAALICDPLFEERRCALRTSVRLADRLSEAGICAARFDYSGTGDSSGIHGHATAHAWVEQIQAMAAECARLAPRLHIIAMRASTLLAVAAAVSCERLTLVAPLKSGKEYLHQLDLRNRLKSQAGGIAQNNAGDFGGFIISQENRTQLEAMDIVQDCKKLQKETTLDIIVVGPQKSLPPDWKALEERASSVSFIREMPFWGQTDYFESNAIMDLICGKQPIH